MAEAEDRFAGVEAFVATVRTGNFTAAASALGMTPSGVAKAVGKLEARIGLKLLHRTTRRSTLTPEGQAYFEACSHAMQALEQAEHGLAPEGATPQGRLHLDLPGAFGRRHVLPGLLARMVHLDRLDLTVSFTERTVDLATAGHDLAVRIGELDDDATLVARRLGTQRLVLCASPGYVQRFGLPDAPAELLRRDCIAGPRRGQKSSWILRTPQGQMLRQEIHPRHEFSDGEAMLAAGLAGCGIMQMPTWLVGEDLRAGRLVTLLDDWAGGEMPIHAIWPQSRFVQPKVRAVVAILQALAAAPGSGFLP